MHFFQIILIFAGLCLDSFVVMMNKGATIKDLPLKKSLSYAGIFAAVASAEFVIGRIFSGLLSGVMNDFLEIAVACLIILASALYIIFTTIRRKPQEEKLDADFDYRGCLRLAFYTNIDTFCIGVSFGFLGVTFIRGLLLAFLMTFATILLALKIGYTQGSRYAKQISIIGGCLMGIFSVYLLIVYVTLR